MLFPRKSEMIDITCFRRHVSCHLLFYKMAWGLVRAYLRVCFSLRACKTHWWVQQLPVLESAIRVPVALANDFWFGWESLLIAHQFKFLWKGHKHVWPWFRRAFILWWTHLSLSAPFFLILFCFVFFFWFCFFVFSPLAFLQYCI